MIDFIDIENTSLPPFCVIFGRKVEVVEEAGQSLPPAAQTREGGAGGQIDGARHLRPGPLEPRMATVLLVPPISSALRTRFSKKENKQLMDSGAPKVCCFILFVTGNVRMRMRRHELLAARRVFLQENLIFLGMKGKEVREAYRWCGGEEVEKEEEGADIGRSAEKGMKKEMQR